MHPFLRTTGLASALFAVAAYPVVAAAAPPQPAFAGQSYVRTDLVSDQPGVAQLTDPNLVNAWGLSHGPDTPLWVSDNGTNVTTLYRGATSPSDPIQIVPLVVATPGGAPTGQVFNDTGAFRVRGTGAPALFIFAGEDGDITAWNQAANPITSAVLMAHNNNAVYKGITISHSPFGPLLLAANFHTGRVDVYNGRFQLLSVAGQFRDPNLPGGYAPFNVAAIGDHVLVSYALQDADREDDVAGAGYGFVDEFTTYGSYVRRLITRGDLNSPWGLTLAPADFGRFSDDLLVGNFGDGRIHAYDPANGVERGVLRNGSGRAIQIDGLWGLLPGDPVAGGPNTLWFSAGPQDESHGLLGTITAG
jgi:uncharacterized protein (TIGR03118 family)